MMQPFVTRLSGEGQRMEPARRRVLEPMNERHQPWVAVCVMCVWESPPLRCRLCVLRGPELPTVRVRVVCVWVRWGIRMLLKVTFLGRNRALQRGDVAAQFTHKGVSQTYGSAFEPKPGTAHESVSFTESGCCVSISRSPSAPLPFSFSRSSMLVRALYAFSATSGNELTIRADERLALIEGGYNSENGTCFGDSG